MFRSARRPAPEEIEQRLHTATEAQRDLAAKTAEATEGAAEATAAGNAVKASELDAAAESFASQLAAVERELEDLDALDEPPEPGDEA